MNYNQNQQFEIALRIVNRGLVNLVYFFFFSLQVLSTITALIIVDLYRTNYFATLLISFIVLFIVVMISLIPYWEKIGRLFNHNDKIRRANEIVEKINEEPLYFKNGLLGDLPNEVIACIKKRLNK